MNRSVRANVTQCQKSWPGLHFVTALKSGGSSAKIIVLELSQKGFKRKNSRKIAHFQSQKCQNWRKSRTKCSFRIVVKQCCREVLWRSVVGKCCEGVLWRSVLVKCCGEVLW